MPPREFILYADESVQKGAYYSNFFGGILIPSNMVGPVSATLASEKRRLYLKDEVKWKKTSRNYLEKYMLLMNCFFSFIHTDIIKVRIMFTPNSLLPRNYQNIIERTNILCFTISS